MHCYLTFQGAKMVIENDILKDVISQDLRSLIVTAAKPVKLSTNQILFEEGHPYPQS